MRYFEFDGQFMDLKMEHLPFMSVHTVQEFKGIV